MKTTREEKILRPGIYERAEEAYAAAKQRKWVGLTFDDMEELAVSKDWLDGARWAESILKEKNGQ